MNVTNSSTSNASTYHSCYPGVCGRRPWRNEGQQPGRDAGAQMFAPYYGIPEEAATGMAAGPLACYLYTFFHQRKTTFQPEQGYLMHPPSPSILTAHLRIDGPQITSLQVGGRATVSHSITVMLEE